MKQGLQHSEAAAKTRQRSVGLRPIPTALTQEAAPLPLQHTLANPAQAEPAGILALQRTVGNRAVAGLIQAKLKVGPVGDRYEQEADRVAEQVVSFQPSAASRQPAVQRQGPEEEEEVQTKPIAASITPLVQRQPEGRQQADGSFEASPSLESRLAAQRGGGSPLPDETRAFMEPRFGADFSGARVHTGGEAVQMNRELNAQAFTHGQDIYLSAGKYSPGSDAGKRLLAHELTHVIQQGGGQQVNRGTSSEGDGTSSTLKRDATSPAMPGSTPDEPAGSIQRLSWQGTQWSDATKAWASTGGGMGVLFVTDNTPANPVVVKSGEAAAAEVALASSLHQQLWGEEEGGGDWAITTPGARMVSDAEAQQIKKHVGPKVAPGDERAERIVNGVSGAGTMVFEYATGKDFQKILKEPKHTRKRWFRRWKRTTRSSSPLFTMLKDAGYIRSLGKTTAVDIFTSNWDRLTMLWNPENWKVDTVKKAIQLVDNVLMGPGFAFKSYAEFKETMQASFNAWKGSPWTQRFAANNYDEIAQKVAEKINEGIVGDVRAQDQKIVQKKLNKYLPDIKTWFASGVQEGKTRLLAILQDPEKLVAGLPEEFQEEVLQALALRATFIGGTPAKTSKIGKLKSALKTATGSRFERLGAFKYV